MSCQPDYRQAIAESWPQSMDDTAVRSDWGWQPQYTMEKMTSDMLVHLALNKKRSKKNKVDKKVYISITKT